MEIRVSLREANQRFSRYVRAAEQGNVVVITRRGQPVARLVAEPQTHSLSPEQMEARLRTRARMRRGYPLGGVRIDRTDLHERGAG
ncbi:type II toxin-antitoxin system prevent-host-death family antitoxin [Deferrisoma camini]|uniref:type II toxin-antitoxin system prevent-host-death family antitoxin n=1 Tax=Deferrisoma camini TaxID=1035120 RepID=UPI00046D7546